MDIPAIDRALRPVEQISLLDLPPDWKSEWWGMPEFSMGDASPQHKITVNFLTTADVVAFAKRLGVPVTSRSDSVWYPHQRPLDGSVAYVGPPTDSRYPVCIPSKGRAIHQTTGKVLDRLGVSYKFFVEETEYDSYCTALGEQRVVAMPFHDLGLGSVPARNFIWDWCAERGTRRHWTLDDNIGGFVRLHANRRLRVRGGGFFEAMESFVDRYTNIAMAGPHHLGFAPDRLSTVGPYLLNSRVYSCILLDTALPFRWRGRYNEDTDLSLRLLKSGYCTLLFRALLMDKHSTVGVRNTKPMPGGNTDNVYTDNDARRRFADALVAQHPDVASTVWKFNRWHHHVDYKSFRGNTPIKQLGIVPLNSANNFNMRLERIEENASSEDVVSLNGDC